MHVASAENFVCSGRGAAHCHHLPLPESDGNNEINAPTYFATGLQGYSGPTATQIMQLGKCETG